MAKKNKPKPKAVSADTSVPSRREGAIISAAPEALRKIEAMFGSPAAAPAMRLAGATISGENIKLIFESSGCDQFAVWISPHSDSPHYTRNSTLQITFEGTESTPLNTSACEMLRESLDGVLFSTLEGVINEDAVNIVFHKSGGGEDGKDEPRRLSSAHQWGHPDQWRDFCAFGYLMENAPQNFIGEFSIAGESVTVRHGELECQCNMNANSAEGLQPTILKTILEARKNAPDAHPKYYISFIDEKDVIMGSGIRKVTGILDYLADKPWCGSVEFKNCCVPMMTGDDVRGALRGFVRKSGKTAYFEDMGESREKRFSEYLERILAEGVVQTERVDAPLYNLVGFHPCRSRGELIEILSDIGAEPNLIMLPEIDLDALGGYNRAALQILLPNIYYANIFDKLSKHEMRTCLMHGPFGVEATKEWVIRAAGMMGDETAARAADALEGRTAEILPEWNRLTESAAGRRVALILGPGDPENLSLPMFTGGVLLHRVIEEMGFGIDFLAFSPADSEERTDTAPLFSALRDTGRHKVTEFANRDELKTVLSDAKIDAAYSNFNYDRRLSRAGVGSFSLKDFHFGLRGAVKTLRLILDVCENPFFRGYGRYFGK